MLLLNSIVENFCLGKVTKYFRNDENLPRRKLFQSVSVHIFKTKSTSSSKQKTSPQSYHSWNQMTVKGSIQNKLNAPPRRQSSR